jgi:two-component system cell cycle sensor histidine kinase/response regulator CckA
MTPGGAARVLVVDDDASVRTFIELALRRQGHEVLLAVDADAALTFASDASRPIDLLLTDYTMPGRSGVQLAADVRALRPDIAVILMSGWRMDQPPQGVPGPGIETLEKPFDLTGLARAVERALRLRPRS